MRLQKRTLRQQKIEVRNVGYIAEVLTSYLSSCNENNNFSHRN